VIERVYRRELRAWEQGGMDGDVVGIEMGPAARPVPPTNQTFVQEQLL
jgi:uncharacterized protein YuzE